MSTVPGERGPNPAAQRLDEQRREFVLQRERVAAALDGTNAGVWEWNVQSGETTFDERWAAIVGYTLDELAPVSIETWMRLAHPDDLAGSGQALERVFSHEAPLYDFEARMRHRDGSWVWVHDRGKVVEWDAAGRPLRMAGTHTDITDRKRAEQMLRDSEALYHALFDESRAVKLLVDPADGALVDVNPAACEFYGYDREQLRAMKISDVNTLPPEVIHAEMQHALLHEKGYFRFRHRLAGGDVRDVEVYSNPIVIGGRRLLASIVHDVTERRRAEAARLELERQLQLSRKAESLARMAGAVAHRFNNQLQAVLGNLELARIAVEAEGAGTARLDDALRVTQDAAQLCSLMLTYLGQKQGRPERLDAAEFCRARMHRMRNSQREGVTLDLHAGGAPVTVWADTLQLQTALEHLVANAAESRETGAVHVRLSLGRIAAGDLPVRGRFPLDWAPTEPEYACLSVSDDGPGIVASDTERIFDPFFTTKFTGRGMGLPVVLGVARTFGGAVVVESAPGLGSTFRICLPLVE